MTASDLTALLGTDGFSPVTGLILGVAAAVIALFIAVGAGMAIINSVRVVLVKELSGLPASKSSRSVVKVSDKSYNPNKFIPSVSFDLTEKQNKLSASLSFKESTNYFERSRKLDAKYRDEDLRAVHAYHERENARFGIETSSYS